MAVAAARAANADQNCGGPALGRKRTGKEACSLMKPNCRGRLSVLPGAHVLVPLSRPRSAAAPWTHLVTHRTLLSAAFGIQGGFLV